MTERSSTSRRGAATRARMADSPVAATTVELNGSARPAVADELGAGRTAASERVLAAGIELFSSFGFLATTIRELTGQCGITAAAFYNHFDSKETLLYTIISEANAQLGADLAALTLDDDDPARSLQALVKTLVTFNVTYPKHARIANREYVFLQHNRLQEVIDHRRRVRAMFEHLLSSEQTARGLVVPDTHPDPDALEIRLLAISIVNISIASSDWFHTSGPLSISEFAEAHARLVLRMAGLRERRRAKGSRLAH